MDKIWGEFVGGRAAWGLAGLLTPLAALGVIGVMSVAAAMVHGAHPWVGAAGQPSKESALGYLAFALLLLAGPGRLSLDALLFGGRRGVTKNETREARAPLGVRS